MCGTQVCFPRNLGRSGHPSLPSRPEAPRPPNACWPGGNELRSWGDSLPSEAAASSGRPRASELQARSRVLARGRQGGEDISCPLHRPVPASVKSANRDVSSDHLPGAESWVRGHRADPALSAGGTVTARLRRDAGSPLHLPQGRV